VTALVDARVELRELLVPQLAGLLAGDCPAGRVWADGYPLEGTLVAARMLVRLAEQGGYRSGFGMYQVVERASGRVVGDIGFHAAPDEHGAVEIGYGVVSGVRGQGLASAAVRLLTRWALSHPAVTEVRALTGEEHVASRRVLAAAGFELVASDGATCRYRMLAKRSDDAGEA
jgi:RimJ/RimL family protein N-acetyltransferase